MAEAPVGTNTVFIDVGKGPEAFAVTTDYTHEGNLIPSVLPDFQTVKIIRVLPQGPGVDSAPGEPVVESDPQPSEPVQPVDKAASDVATTEEQKSCIEIQTRRIKCPECPRYSAENEEKMLRHIRKVHRGENPFACLMCDYSTYNKTLFEEHVHIHQGIKPYKCSHCDHSSVSKKNLKKHELIHRPDNPLRCKVCPFIANNKTTLNKHLRVNHVQSETPTKEFVCKLCDFTTRNKKKWHTHNRYHKLLICKTRKCSFKTTWESKYNEHVKNCKPKEVSEKTVEKFQCQICGWSSKQDVKILLHLIHHPNQDVDESVVDISVLRKHDIMP